MDLEKLRPILRSLKKHGTLQVSYVGGEPTIHPQYREIIEYTRSQGFYITVSTNGLVREPLLAAEKRQMPHLVSVSLDGPPDVHDRYRGKGTCGMVLATLQALKERKVPTTIHAVIGNHSCHIDTIRWLLDRCNEMKTRLGFAIMEPRLSDTNKGNPFSSSPDEIRNLMGDILTLPRAERSRLIYGDNILRRLATWETLIPCYRTIGGRECFAGRNFAYITPIYDIAPCSLFSCHPDFTGNNIIAKGFDAALRDLHRRDCNDCYVGCYMLRNDILSLNPAILRSTVNMVFGR